MQQICPSFQDIILYWTHRQRLSSLLGMDVRCIICENKHESLQQKENPNIHAGSLIFCPTLCIRSTVLSPAYTWETEFLELSHWAPLSSGSSWFLPMGGTNRRSQEGRREIGVFISRVPRCWAAGWLWLPVLLKVIVPARLFSTTTVAVMSGNHCTPWAPSGLAVLVAPHHR